MSWTIGGVEIEGETRDIQFFPKMMRQFAPYQSSGRNSLRCCASIHRIVDPLLKLVPIARRATWLLTALLVKRLPLLQ